MLWQRMWYRWESFAPSALISFFDTIERRLDLPGELLDRCIVVGLIGLKQRRIPNSSNISEDTKKAMEESVENISMSIYLFFLGILTMSFAYSWSYLENIYPVLLLAGIMRFSSHCIDQSENTEDMGSDMQEWIWADSITVNNEIHTDNLKSISNILVVIAMTIQVANFHAPPDIVRIATVLLALLFLPHFLDLFMVISAAVAVVIFSAITVGAMILVSITFGPCSVCIVFLAFYVSPAIDMVADLIPPLMKFLSDFSDAVSDW